MNVKEQYGEKGWLQRSYLDYELQPRLLHVRKNVYIYSKRLANVIIVSSFLYYSKTNHTILLKLENVYKMSNCSMYL